MTRQGTGTSLISVARFSFHVSKRNGEQSIEPPAVANHYPLFELRQPAVTREPDAIEVSTARVERGFPGLHDAQHLEARHRSRSAAALPLDERRGHEVAVALSLVDADVPQGAHAV